MNKPENIATLREVKESINEATTWGMSGGAIDKLNHALTR